MIIMRIRRSKEEWFELVKRFDSEIMSLEQYCELNQISTASYYVYKRKLKAQSSEFLPIVFEEEVKQNFVFESNGHKIEVDENIDDAFLKKIIRATHHDF